MPILRRSCQSAAEQRTEVHVFALLGAIRIAMLWFGGALEVVRNQLPFRSTESVEQLSAALRGPAVILYAVIVLSLYGRVLLGRRIPPIVLDLLGLWVVANLAIHFVKINLLMLSDVRSPALLLGQIVCYLIFFVVAWGWIFWRFDRVAGPPEQTILSATEGSLGQGSFDYYYLSLMALLAQKTTLVQGLSKLGKTLVAIHSFMLLDLGVIALARVYQLVQRAL